MALNIATNQATHITKGWLLSVGGLLLFAPTINAMDQAADQSMYKDTHNAEDAAAEANILEIEQAVEARAAVDAAEAIMIAEAAKIVAITKAAAAKVIAQEASTFRAAAGAAITAQKATAGATKGHVKLIALTAENTATAAEMIATEAEAKALRAAQAQEIAEADYLAKFDASEKLKVDLQIIKMKHQKERALRKFEAEAHKLLVQQQQEFDKMLQYHKDKHTKSLQARRAVLSSKPKSVLGTT